MTESIFAGCPELDIAYLDDSYADDAESASLVFQQYLSDLPSNIINFEKCFRERDLTCFRKCMHQQKPSYTFVGLTEISYMIHELQVKCQTVDDLTACQAEIEDVFKKIRLSAHVIERACVLLQNRAA